MVKDALWGAGPRDQLPVSRRKAAIHSLGKRRGRPSGVMIAASTGAAAAPLRDALPSKFVGYLFSKEKVSGDVSQREHPAS